MAWWHKQYPPKFTRRYDVCFQYWTYYSSPYKWKARFERFWLRLGKFMPLDYEIWEFVYFRNRQVSCRRVA